MCMCVYVCVYVCVSVHKHVYVCMYMYVFVHILIPTHTHTQASLQRGSESLKRLSASNAEYQDTVRRLANELVIVCVCCVLLLVANM